MASLSGLEVRCFLLLALWRGMHSARAVSTSCVPGTREIPSSVRHSPDGQAESGTEGNLIQRGN